MGSPMQQGRCMGVVRLLIFAGSKKGMTEKKYSGYGYHGGGRKATGIKRVSICISGQPEQIEKLKKMAAQEEKTVSAFILEKTGVMK